MDEIEVAERAGRSPAAADSYADPVLRIEGVWKVFDTDGGPVSALRGVDLAVRPGEFVAVMGPSGSGKSTLLNLIAGLDESSGGSIMLSDIAVMDKDANELAIMRRQHVGFVFQFFRLLEDMTVLENVALAAMIAGTPRRRSEQAARDLLDVLGLGSRLSALATTLSGGQRQRLALARALVNQPTVLLADEPTGALDSAGAEEIAELLNHVNGEGQTIVLVTHNERVAHHAGRVVRMTDGRIEPSEVMVDPPVIDLRHRSAASEPRPVDR